MFHGVAAYTPKAFQTLNARIAPIVALFGRCLVNNRFCSHSVSQKKGAERRPPINAIAISLENKIIVNDRLTTSNRLIKFPHATVELPDQG